jgi:2,3-bisphosphoglycerate-independent phosphoglycerate mutase
MSMMGYDPKRYHTGRAPIEAASMGIAMGPDDVVFRMNLVSLTGDGDATVMNDFTSGHITTEEAARIVTDFREQLGRDGIEFFNGVSYRHLMVWRDGPRTTRLTPPHDITGKTIEGNMPEGEGADRLLALMNKSRQILRDHPVNKARRAHGKTEATSAWFWGQGTRPAVPTLKERFGLEGSVISAVDLVNGVGRLAGLEVIKVPGATGFLDTDYAAKGRYGLKSLERKDFLLLHIEAPDEAGHMGRADLKKEAIERIDEAILGPMLEGLTRMGEFRLLLQPDHSTPSILKTHSSEAVPFAIISNRSFDSGGGGKSRRYTEADAKAAGDVLTDGYRLIDTLLGSGGLIEAN